ncbi:MAG TPA: DUF6029 family protein [Candidatus Limnocylindria bacterium]|nr:DUF6029 family protein [Candidatus Limnocylindria bacterium]
MIPSLAAGVGDRSRLRPPRRRAGLAFALGLAASLLAPAGATAQLSISNLLEAQSGNLPFRTPKNRTDLYEQLNLDLALTSLRFGVRFESDQNSEERRTYRAFTQRYAEWNDERLRVRIGNFYTIVGRGLVHRSFELPGVVLDKDGARSKYSPSRDLDGVLAEGRAGPFTAVLFDGKPNGGEFSPGLAVDRYRGHLSGGELSASFLRTARAGVGFVRSTTNGLMHQELGTGFAGIDPLDALGVRNVALPLYVEYAQIDRSFEEWVRLRTSDRVPHALYASSGLVWGRFALSAEWKDYVGFRLGTNDPPSLVREHSWTLLNRNTHLLDAGGIDPPSGESGFQIEGSLRLPASAALVVNFSRSDLLRFSPGRFEERFVELDLDAVAGLPIDVSTFYDQGEDSDLLITERDGFGGAATVRARDIYSATLGFERVNATREFDGPFHDVLLTGTVARAGWGSLSLSWERSTDSAQEEPDDVAPGVQPRHFVAGVLNAQISEHHDLTLFAGERRGGRACTAGTCYEVLPFEGVEMRLTSRF